jgi:hypothetical protein
VGTHAGGECAKEITAPAVQVGITGMMTAGPGLRLSLDNPQTGQQAEFIA